MYATRALFRPGAFRPTMRMMRPVPKEEHSAHTISQRLRRLKQIPVELLPLGFVVILALVAATYSSLRHFLVDKTIRLKRTNRLGENRAASAEHKSGDGGETHH